MDQLSQIADAHPVLTRDEERELFRLWQQHGDESARDRIVRSNIKFVYQIARMRKCGNFDDLVAEGMAGLAIAIDRFEPERGLRFITYAAFWIKAQIYRYQLRNWSVVSGGVPRSGTFFSIRREIRKSRSLYSDEEDAQADASRNLGMTVEDLCDALNRIERHALSLNEELENGQPFEWLMSDGKDHEQITESHLDRQLLRDEIDRCLAVLNEREVQVIRLRFLSRKPWSLEEIGQQMGVSRERIRQIEERSLEKLYRRLHQRGLCFDDFELEE
jgi:RNA polymerase sigma-32 factor